MSFYSDRWVNKTRKPHRCGWCWTMIEMGARAHYAAGITIDGDFWNGYTHPECEAAIDWLVRNTDDLEEGYNPGDGARGRRDNDRTKPPEFSSDYPEAQGLIATPSQ